MLYDINKKLKLSLKRHFQDFGEWTRYWRRSDTFYAFQIICESVWTSSKWRYYIETCVTHQKFIKKIRCLVKIRSILLNLCWTTLFFLFNYKIRSTDFTFQCYMIHLLFSKEKKIEFLSACKIKRSGLNLCWTMLDFYIY